MFPVVYHIGELPYPVAQNHHTHLAREHEVEFDMTMTIHEIVDVGMGLHILLGVSYEIFLVLAHIWRLLAVGTLHAASPRPLKSEPHSPTRMQRTEEVLAEAVVEHLAYEFEARVRVAQSVAMSQIEHLAVDVHRFRLLVQDDATLLLQISIHPDVVVAGGDMIMYTIAVEELSRVCGTTGVILSAHTSLCAMPIFMFGTPDQKAKYLPKLASGEWIGAFGLTEPNAGTDASAQQTTAVLEDDHYVLNGNKIFITNAGEANVYVVAAMTDKSQGVKGISTFIVESTFPRFSSVISA